MIGVLLLVLQAHADDDAAVVTADILIPPASLPSWTVIHQLRAKRRGHVPEVITDVDGLSVSCALDGRRIEVVLIGGHHSRVPEEITCQVGDNLVEMTVTRFDPDAPDPPKRKRPVTER